MTDQNEVPYFERVKKGRILAQEYPVFLNHEEKNWQGVIDLILEEDRVSVIDFKTGRKPLVLPDSYQRQAEIYKQAVQSLLPHRTVEFEFWWLNSESVCGKKT